MTHPSFLMGLPVRLVQLPDHFIPELFPVKHDLHGRFAATHPALVGWFGVVVLKSCIQISLKLLQRVVEFASEDNLIKLMEDSFVKTFADAIGLRISLLGSCMFNAVYSKVQLTIMRFHFAAVFRATVCLDANDPHLLVERKGNTRSFRRSVPVMGVLVA